MNNLPLWVLFLVLIICLVISAFFSASETAMMSLNRYKLKHLTAENNLSAKRVTHLLEKTERLLATILLGNNFVNILAASIATIIGTRLYGEYGVLVATVVLTIIVLIFSEVTPKTFAALYPEKIAFPFARLLKATVFLLAPFVKLLNILVSLLLKPFGLNRTGNHDQSLTTDELKTVVLSSSQQHIMRDRQDMLIGVLELEDVSVEEVMVTRNDIFGIDLNNDLQEINRQIQNTTHNRIIAYQDNIDHAQGILHIRDLVPLYQENQLSIENIVNILKPCTFVPEGTPLRTQLLNFQNQKNRSGLVVDEYGDIQGLVTMEDILVYIVGDIASEDDVDNEPEIVKKNDNFFEADGGIILRNLNKELNLKLPLEGPNTLSGLIIETLGNFPEVGTELDFTGCRIRVLSFENGVVEKAEIELLE